jgi:hypothetical protein
MGLDEGASSGTAMTDLQWKFRLRALLTKVDGVAAQVALQDGFVEIDSIIAGWIDELGGKINPPWASRPLTISWGLYLLEALSGLDENSLIAIDKQWAAILWPPSQYPQYAGHTISWILGQEEAAGSIKARLFCDALAVFLGAGHCQTVLSLPPQ